MTTMLSYSVFVFFEISILFFLQRLLFWLMTTNFGLRSVYISAIVGTPIHETSHAIMCLIFGHKINKINFFYPDNKGTLGYVNHSYNKRNLWHVLGNFFIGLAPLFGGAICIYLLCLFLMPSGELVIDLFQNNSNQVFEFSNIWAMLLSFKTLLITDIENQPVQLCLWAYLSAAVALHLTPSKEDVKGAFVGFIYFLLLCGLCAAIIFYFDVDLMVFNEFTLGVLQQFSLIFAVIISLASLLLLFIIFLSYPLKLFN